MKFFRKNTLSAAMTMAIAISSGSAIADHTTLTNSDGWRYYFDPSESEIFDIDNTGAGLTDITNSAFRLYIDGVQYNGSSNSAVLGGEGRLGGEQTLSGLTVTRETFVPANANFLRQVSTLTNPTAAPIVVTVAMNNNSIDANGANVTVPSSSSGDAAAGTNDVWVVVNGDVGDAVLVHVFGATGAAEIIDSMGTITGNTTFDYEWQNVSVPANGSVMFVTFTAGAADDAAAQAAATSLTALGGFATQMQGIAPADYSKIVNLNFADTDGDGMVDAYENVSGLNPAFNDAADDLDSDGLSNIAEFNAGSKPNVADTDGDGLSDGEEVNTHSTDPTNSDSDGDGISDGAEITAGSNPNDGRDGGVFLLSDSGDAGQHSPDVAVDSQGRIHTVWMQDVTTPDPVTPTTTYTDFNVMYKLLDKDANVLIDTTQLSDSFTDGNSNQGHPSIAIGANDHPYVTWFSSSTSDGYIVGLDPATAPLDGTASTLAGLQKFAPVMLTDCKRSDLAVDSTGNMHVACASNNGTTDVAVVAADGTVVQAPFAITSSDNDGDYAHSRVQLTLDASNMAHVVWADNTNEQVYYAMVDGVTASTKIDATQLSNNPGSTGNSFFPSIDLDASGKAYVVWGDNVDDNNGDTDNADVFLGRFTPSLDDQDGSAGDLSAMGLTAVNLTPAVDGEHAWYVTAAMGSDNQIVITHNTDGGNGIAPRYFLKVDQSGAITTPKTRVDVDGGVGNYETYGNFVSIAEADTNVIAYVTDDTQDIKLGRLDGSAFFATTDPNAPVPVVPVAPAAGSSSSGFALSLWSLLGLPALVGLLRLKRRR